MPIELRTFTDADHARAFALWLVTPGVGLSAADSPEGIQTFLARNPGTSFTAWYDQALVGTILCGHDGRRGLIHHLVTAPSHRRQGIATMLLRAGLDALRQHGIDKCHLLVFSSNLGGLSFWRGVGAQERTELSLLSLQTAPEDLGT